MELTIERAKFLNELQILQGVVERKNTIPILANILLKTEDGGLDLTSTDLDLTLHTRVKAQIGSTGGVCVPARKLFDLVRSLESDQLKLKLLENHYLGLTAGNGKYKLVAQPAEDFPTVPRLEGTSALSLPLSLWKRMTRKVLFAVSSEEKRFQLSGALLKEKGKELELVATDGHRLAVADFPRPGGKSAMPPLLIPKKALSEILKIDAPDDAELSISHSENHLAFSVGDRKLIVRLLDVNFPEYEKVLVRDNDKSITIARQVLENVVRRIALFSSDRVRGVRLSLEKNALTVSSASQELGEGTETVEVSYTGEPVAIGLNAQYLLDFLAEAETENVRMDFKDENTQCLCRPAGDIPDMSSYVYVVMPMRL
jgi:DNA polymerase-3 subunit beta